MPIFKPIKQSQNPEHQTPENAATRSIPEEPQRKGLLARFRNLQLSRPDPKPEILPDIDPQPPTPQDEQKAERRRARREQRQKREEQWNEEYRQRRNYAIEVGIEMRPLTPLSDFDSASEDERTIPSHYPPPSESNPPLPSHPSLEQPPEQPLDPMTSIPPVSHQPHQMDQQPLPTPEFHSTQAPPHDEKSATPRDPKKETQLAEMFAAQAFSAPLPNAVPSQSHQQSSSYPAPANHQFQPSPIGWGGVYHSVPSQPMYGTPVHLSPVPRTVLDIEPMLAENIRRGRELAMLAIEQEERGNLGAAEAGYIKALSMLVPASKQLDTGSELNKNARMQQKAKIQREAAAMLDRCEELRVFLRANGPPVPNEMPTMPNQVTRRKSASAPKKQSSLGAPPSRGLPPTPSPSHLPIPPESREQKQNDPKPALKPPAPPPPMRMPHDSSPSQLLNRLTSRKDVLASASTIVPPDMSREPIPVHPPAKDDLHGRAPRTNEKCFMCSAPAQLRTKCGHAYCSNCGNQAVSVFGQCPVPDCGTVITVEDFEHIL